MCNTRKILSSILVSIMFLLIGCDNEDVIEADIRPKAEGDFGAKARVKIRAVNGNAYQKGHFNRDGQIVYLKCSFSVTGIIDGEVTTKVYSHTFEACGAKGGEYGMECDDPLVVQLPLYVQNISATFTDINHLTTALSIKDNLTKIRTGIDDFIFAEQGKQLVMINAFYGATSGTYELNFDLPEAEPIEVKSLMVGRFTYNDIEIFPKILSDSMSAINIPVSDTLVPIPIPLDNLHDSKFNFDCPDDSLVGLANLKVIAKVDGIQLRWLTSSEKNNVGFRFWRAIKKQYNSYEPTLLREFGHPKKINSEPDENCSTKIQGQLKADNSSQFPKLISAIGNSTESTCYSFTDTSNLSDGTYYYLLEDIDDNGDSTFHCNQIDAVTIGQGPAIDLESAINYCKEVTGSND